MVPRCQKTYKNFEVCRTRIKADRRPTSVRYYKFLDGITCTNQFFNGAEDSISSSLKLKRHFGVSHTEFSRSNQQVLPFVRYKMAADKCRREEAKAAEREIARHQKEHGCEDERRTAWVKEAKRRSEDVEFCRIQREKKLSELDRDKLKSKRFELAEHSKKDGKNKHSLKVKESQMKAEVAIYLDGVNVSTIPAGDSIDVRVKACSIFQFDGRERVYPDYVVPSTLAPQEHRIAPCKLQVNLFYDKDIDVYVDGQSAYNCPAVFGKNGYKIICEIGQTLHFQGKGKEYEVYTVPNQDDHDHASHLVLAICHQIPIAEYPPMPPPTHLPQLQYPVPLLHLQSPKGADFPANN
eukprot:jgi/Psemu1/26075/gm1.26075_g